MKAFIVRFDFEQLEVPWSDSERGCEYHDPTVTFISIAETASKARYQVAALCYDSEYFNLYYGLGEMLCLSKVKRTKRKYIYKRPGYKMLEWNGGAKYR